MVRISAIFIAVCMVLIAVSIGAVLYLRFGFTTADAALVALGVLSALAVYNAVAGRKSDRAEVNNQVSSLARGSGDIARQVAEFGRRLSAVESKVETALDKAQNTAAPLATEIEELSRLVRQLAESVAQHDLALARAPDGEREAPRATAEVLAAVAANAPEPTAPPGPMLRKVPAFSGLDRDGVVALVRSAIESQKIDLYLQPIVTLPQRKVPLLRGLVAAQCRQRRTRVSRGFSPLCRSRCAAAQARQSVGTALRSGRPPPAAQEPRSRPVL